MHRPAPGRVRAVLAAKWGGKIGQIGMLGAIPDGL